MDFLQSLRLKNLFNPDEMSSNDYQPGIHPSNIPSINMNTQPMNPENYNPGISESMLKPSLPDFQQNLLQSTPINATLGIPSSRPDLNTSQTSPFSTEMSDRFKSLLDQYPNREELRPSTLRRIGGGIIGGLAGPQLGAQFTNDKFNDALTDWENRIKPVEQGANIERQVNVNERTLMHQQTANDLRQQAIDLKDKNDTKNANIKQQRADIYDFKVKNPELKLLVNKGGNVMAFDPRTGKMADTGYNSGVLSDADRLSLTHDFKLNEIGTQQKGRETIQGMKGIQSQALQGTKASDILQQISTRGEQARLTKAIPTSPKVEGITNQTKVIMEGAQMLLPHLPELQQQAVDLDKRGLFGPIMSRIRNLAAKVGTTGSPQEVQKSLEDFASVLTSDPQLNNDAAVGQFVTSLGLIASGTGRVHGGARGGGSIQMVNYMKSLLSSDSSINMFLGRLKGLHSYLKGYAEGPQKIDNTKLDSALDKIFGSSK